MRSADVVLYKLVKKLMRLRVDEKKAKTEERPFWSKRMTDVLKTIAIVLMFIHHFFTFSAYLPEGHGYSWASVLEKYCCAPTKICVAIFAFISGYMYYFSKKKDLKRAGKSIWSLLSRYWTVAVPLIGIALICGVYPFHFVHVLMEFFGLRSDVMSFAWYVYFFIFLMLFLPFLIRISKDHPIVILLLSLILFNLLTCMVYSRIDVEINWLRLVFTNCWTTFFPAVSGYLVARIALFPKVKKVTDKIPSILRYLLFFVLALAAIAERYFYYRGVWTIITIGSVKIGFLINPEFLCLPVFIFCTVELLSFVEKTKAIRIFEIIGKYSTYMWFWHCMFFGVLGKYTKGILYAPKIPVLVLLWGLVICLSLSFVSDKFYHLLSTLGKKDAHPKDVHPTPSA